MRLFDLYIYLFFIYFFQSVYVKVVKCRGNHFGTVSKTDIIPENSSFVNSLASQKTFCFTLGTTYGIKCYVCNSATEAKCKDPFDKGSLTLTDNCAQCRKNKVKSGDTYGVYTG